MSPELTTILFGISRLCWLLVSMGSIIVCVQYYGTAVQLNDAPVKTRSLLLTLGWVLFLLLV